MRTARSPGSQRCLWRLLPPVRLQTSAIDNSKSSCPSFSSIGTDDNSVTKPASGRCGATAAMITGHGMRGPTVQIMHQAFSARRQHLLNSTSNS